MLKLLLAGAILLFLYVFGIFIAIQVTENTKLWLAAVPAVLIFVLMLFIYLIVASSSANPDRLDGLEDAASALQGQFVGHGESEIAQLRDRFELIQSTAQSLGVIRCVVKTIPMTLHCYKEVAKNEARHTKFAYAAHLSEKLSASDVIISRRDISFRLDAVFRSDLQQEICVRGSDVASEFSRRFAVLARPENTGSILRLLTEERMRKLLDLDGNISVEISSGEILLVYPWGLVPALRHGLSSRKQIEATMMVKMADEAVVVAQTFQT